MLFMQLWGKALLSLGAARHIEKCSKPIQTRNVFFDENADDWKFGQRALYCMKAFQVDGTRAR